MKKFNSPSFPFFPGKETKPLITNESSKVTCRYFNQNKKGFKLLYSFLLALAGLCFVPDVAKADRAHWNDDDKYWSVTYNLNEGTIHIRVRVYDDDYGPNLANGEDGFVDYAHLQYSTNGNDYTDFYYIDYDSGPTIKEIGTRNGVSASYSTSKDKSNTWLDITLNLNDYLKNIQKIKIVGNWHVNGVWAANSDNIDATRNITISQMSDITTTPVHFITVGSQAKATFGYTKTLNEVDRVSKMQLYNANGNTSRFYNAGASATDSVAISRSDSTYYYKQSAYNGRITRNSADIVVPAFTLPKTASATYDTHTYAAIFSWTIDPVATQNLIKDKFIIQVDDNDKFTSAKEIKIEYDPRQSSYSLNTNDYKIPLTKNMYFRVGRGDASVNTNDWDKWAVAKMAKVVIPFDPLESSKVTLKLQGNDTALIKWVPIPTAWLPGASFIITRINNTSRTQSEVKLTKDDYDKGLYIDKQIAICNEYTYTLQIIPPADRGFDASAPVQIANTILPTKIGTISNLTVSKGYFPDRAELKWSSQGAFDNFIIKRAEYNSENYVQLTTVSGLSTSDYQTDDSKGTPGVYYKYMVIGVVNCNNKPIYSKDTLYAIGFRSPTGNIYGRVTYENGQGVQDAAVRLQSKDAAQLGKSVYLDGNANSYLKLDSLHTPFTGPAFTVEAWIKPDEAAPKSQVIFSRGNQYELGFNATGQLYFSYNGKTVTGTYINPGNSFVHVAGIHSHDSLFLMLNESLIDSAANQYAAATKVDKAIYIGRNAAGKNFKGYVDEMRIWNIALSQSLIARDYTRLMSGGESGLVAYWRFDESIKDQFYDASHNGGQYNQNDGVIKGNVIHTDTLPMNNQLSLKAYTDSTGNYMISGIPFTGNGTTYAIVPLLGTHQFDPGSVNRLISPSSTEFTVDFKDKSSFAVSGFVYYSGGKVPVSKVQFKIDDKYAQQSNGDIIETDEDGRFTVYVPVGTHEVKAVKNNHVFENGGKITDYLLHNLNYQKPLSGYELHDSTTVRFIGRVAGGAKEEAYPLGHSLSTNNLGKELSITMTLSKGSQYEIYSGSENKKESIVIVKHLLPSSQTDSTKIHKSKVVYEMNEIKIYPDSLTGEFEADLIPEKFTVNSVKATGWDNLLDGKKVSVDFTNKFFIQKSPYSYKDSIKSYNSVNDGVWKYTDYSDTVYYNVSYKFIKRVDPTVSIIQLDNNEKELPFFGSSTYASLSFTGKTDTIPLIDMTKKDTAMYLMGNPVFKQNESYHFKIKAFEEYPFYESEKSDGTKVKAQQNGKDIVSHVPTQDGKVSIYNKLRNGAADAEVRSLDSNGTAVYDFIGGDPDIAAKGLKDFSASIQFGPANNITWSWLGARQMKAYVLGGKMTGTDFVTAGPNQILMVLRDPPGSRSYAYAENGSTISHTTTYTGTVDQAGDEDFVQKMGVESVTFQGIGFGIILKTELEDGIGFGVHHEEHYTGSNTKVSSTTLTTRYQTSDAPTFVGEAGDVFVGYSTNFTYGSTRNITIIKRSEKKASDSLVYEPDLESAYLIVQRTGINLGENFGTLFAYPQQHIEQVLIPNLRNIRNTILLPPTTSPATAQQMADQGKSEVYVSKLPLEDTNFGKTNSDIAFGPDAKKDPFYDGKSYTIYIPTTSAYRTDTIKVLNQYIDDWKAQLAENEKVKLNAALLQNYSFHAGSPVQYSEQTSHDTTRVNSFNIIIAGSVTNSTMVNIMKNGFELTINESIGTAQGGEFDSTSSTSKNLGFVLASDGTDDYFSVDVSKAADGSFVFRTKGGESACPYEGATYTKYYQPGTILNQPTARIEVPKLSVDKTVINNIPSSRKASYTLSLRNESEAKLPATFVLGYTDNDSIKGATIAIDGTPIGGSGRAVVVQYGQTVTKVLTLTKGPDAMDYNNIPILLHSSCQYDPTGYQATIADTVLISAHFIPSCSDIHLKAPADKWVVNSKSPIDANGKRYLPITIDQFDITNSLFDHIELQYKPSSESAWGTAISFYSDSTKFKAAQDEKQFITNAQGINYNLVLGEDQNYDVQAVSYCLLGPGNYITTQSNMASGIKDTYFPRLFGSPQPANGVLGVNDQIRLNFNEQIAAGLLTYSDFDVTGIRNGVQGDHTVSVRLDGKTDYLASEFDKNVTAKNITVEMWVLPDKQANGTVFSQGNINKSMELSFTTGNLLQVIIGAKVIESDKPLDYKQGEWAHVALVYNATNSTVAAFYNFTEVIHNVAVDKYDGIGHFEFGRSISKQGNFFAGKMHQVEIWTEALTATAIQLNSLTRLSGTENSLLAYYPMNEGKGKIAFDKAHSSNAQLIGNWNTPAGKSISFNGNGYVKMNTAAAPVTSDMDYTLGLWFKADQGQTNVTLASNGKGDGTDMGGSFNLFSLGFEQGLLTYQNNGFKVQADGNYLDNNWHHVAVAVNRNSGNAQLFVDGLLNKYFDAKNLGGIAAAYTYLGARAYHNQDSSTVTYFDRYYKGNVDEFRIWNTYLNQTLISKNNNVRLKGNELGLMVYYPFERYIEFQNNTTMGFTLKDMALQRDTNLKISDAVAVSATESDDMAPIKDRGPVENLQFDFVVNNDALIINLLEPKQAIDKTILTFTVNDVRDLNGNPILSPITWTAYIDQNQIKWSDAELNLIKDVYAPMQFESYLVNSGGNIQNFRLSNLPSWLTADPLTGTIDPKGKQKVIFTVNEGLNVGSYDEIVFMHNDNNESESLKLNLKVKAKQPDWKVNPTDFKYNMSVYGNIRINKIFSINSEDILAAFMNGRCVGVTRNTYDAKNDLWYAFLTVYSDTLQYGKLEFRIWQASTGKTYQGIPSLPVTFVSNAIIGTARSPVIFDGSEMIIQDIVLNQNWNWISLNVANANFSNISATLGNGNWSSGDMVKNEELGFNQYSSTAGWVGYLNGFNNTSLFMLKTATAQMLSVNGTAVDVKKTAIPLKGNRWNYISYLPQVNMTVKDALAGYIASDEDVIKSQSGFAMYDSRNGWVGNLTYLEPGKGYMLYRKAAADTAFFYPGLNGSLTNHPGRNMAGGYSGMSTVQLNSLQTPVPGNFSFAENMTVIAVAGGDFALQPGDIVLAFAGGELRGKAQPIHNTVNSTESYFLSIGGTQDQLVSFLVERNGEIIAQSDAVINYLSNKNLGTVRKPLVLPFKKETRAATLYPNPFTSKVNIIVDMNAGPTLGNHDVQMSVYDINGRLVFRQAKETVVSSYFKTTWNGKTQAGSNCLSGVYFINITIDGISHVFKVIKL